MRSHPNLLALLLGGLVWAAGCSGSDRAALQEAQAERDRARADAEAARAELARHRQRASPAPEAPVGVLIKRDPAAEDFLGRLHASKFAPLSGKRSPPGTALQVLVWRHSGGPLTAWVEGEGKAGPVTVGPVPDPAQLQAMRSDMNLASGPKNVRHRGTLVLVVLAGGTHRLFASAEAEGLGVANLEGTAEGRPASDKDSGVTTQPQGSEAEVEPGRTVELLRTRFGATLKVRLLP